MKVVVGQNTIVKKITVGTPLRVGSAANGSLTGLDDVNGSVNLAHDTILQYDSASGKFKHVSPAALASDGLTVAASGMGSLSESGGTLTYVGPSADSITTLFNATYDSNSLGTLTQTGGTTHLVGPTTAQIRGLFSGANSLNYNQATGEFSVTVPSTSAGFDSDLALKTTDDLAEGSNLYYTDSRGRAAITVSDAGGFGSLTYNSASGQIVYTGPSETETRSVLSVGDNLAYDSATGKITFTGNLGGDFGAGDAQAALTVSSTGDYGSLSYNSASGLFTHVGVNDSDIRGALSAGGDLSYNSATGQFTFTQRTDSQVRGLFNAGSNITYDSATGKISANVGTHYTDSDTRQAISVQDLGGAGALSYNNATGQISYQGATDSGIRGVLSASGDISYDQNTGIISFTERTNTEIRSLFNVSGDLGYDTATGVFSVDLGSVDVTDSAVTRALFSVTNDAGDYGSLAYDAASGQFAFTKVTDSDIRGTLSAAGDLSYNQTTGQFSYNKRTDTDIRSLFSGSNDVTYDPNTGVIDVNVGPHYGDSDARNVFSVNFVGDTAFDSSPYGGASYNASTGLLTISGTTDSNIRNSLTVQDSGGLGSLTYNTKQGRIVYTGPGVSDVSSLLSATTDSLSMGKLTLDSSKGQFTLKLEDDSVRALFSVVSDQEGGTNLTYNQETGVFTHSGPSTLDLRSQISAVDAGGDGSFTYFESGGVFTYTGPSAAEARAHFEGGLGIDYNEATGTFRLDSSANIVTGSIVTGQLTVTDSAVINRATVSNRLLVDSISTIDSNSLLSIEGGEIALKSDRILLDAPFLHATDNRIIFSVDDSNPASVDRGGFVIGAGAATKFMLYLDSYEHFLVNTGLEVQGSLTGPTIDSINKRIDELPDSAQTKGILSAGPGLSYDNANGIYRIISSGVTAGTYGNATNVSQLTVDSLGIVTGAVDVPISTVNNFTYDSATGNLKITTATDSFNVGITLDPFTTNNLVEGPNNLYYTRARFDSALDDSTSETRIRQYFRTDLASDSSRQQVRKYINVGASLTYDSATGKLTTNQALDSNSNVRFNNIVQTGQLQGPAEFIIDPAAVGDNTGTVKILGNLQVEGVQTIINSTTVSVNDKNIVLGDSAADSSALHGAGITLGGTNIVDKPSFTYSHAGQRFVFNRNIQADSFYGDVTGNVTGDVVGNLTGNVTGQVSDISNHNTDSLAEGSTNLYFTTQRARNSVSVVDAGGDGSLTYDSAAGQFTYTGPSPAETRQHLNVLDAGGDGSLTYDSALGKFTYTGPSPTETRAHFQVNDTGGDGSLAYDSATGTFTYTGPSEAEFYQHIKNNADSFGDLTFDSNYGTNGGFALHTRHILRHREVYADSMVNNQEYFLMYSGTTGGNLVKVRGDTMASKFGGGGGGAGGGLLGYINM